MPARLFLRAPPADGEMIWVYIFTLRRGIRTRLDCWVPDTLKLRSRINSERIEQQCRARQWPLRCAIQFENLEF
jgi:hypothetical protein